MRTREDIEAYLLRSGLPHEEIGEGTWLVHDQGSGERIVVRLTQELVLFRVKVMELGRVREREKLFERLLELNASEMVHGAYGLADGAVVLTCVMRLANLDYEEFQGTIDDFSLALTNHYETLASFHDAA
ncbi:MAG: YbjN domain-containing protein [Myxococcota bacterium]